MYSVIARIHRDVFDKSTLKHVLSHLLAMMLSQVLEQRANFVWISRVVYNVLYDREHPRSVHLERVGAGDALVDLDELELVKVFQHLKQKKFKL
jgi:hypothetical protein